jgi:hypothetical protein
MRDPTEIYIVFERTGGAKEKRKAAGCRQKFRDAKYNKGDQQQRRRKIQETNTTEIY